MRFVYAYLHCHEGIALQKCGSWSLNGWPMAILALEGSSFRPTSARCKVPCWHQQLECEWNAKLQNWCSWALIQLASENVLEQPSVLFSVGLLRSKFQVSIFYIFKSLAIW